ncbi:hypothetical protein ABZ281_48385, partial [Streptomyces sp. NPDC006265]
HVRPCSFGACAGRGLGGVGYHLAPFSHKPLLGTAVGALTSRPLLRPPGRAVLALLLAALLSLVATGSPAQAAVRGLVTGSRQGEVPLLPLAAAALVTAAAPALAGALASRRSP